ncbi:MAG TPA: CBS domain-containing protein [Sphingobacteriaceae bacterium]
MTAREMISQSILPVRTSDSVQKVLDRMAEFRVSHLPIVNNIQFLGLISEDDLIEVPDYETPVGGLSLSLYNTCVQDDQHIYEVIRMFYQHKLTLVPVMNEKNDYLGVISVNTMVEYMATLTAVREPGGIIVLEISNRDNSLSHIAQVVESDNAQILSSYIRSFPESTKLEITLKVNKTDISGIVASFNRYDYVVKATYNNTKSDTQTRDRYDQFMNYLDI